MRKATKVLYFILGLIVLAYTGFTFWLLYNFMYLESGWAEQFGLTTELFYAGFYATCALAALTGLVGFGLIIRALTAKRRDFKITSSPKGGTVEITEDAIKSSIRATLSDYPDIEEKKVQLNLNDKSQTIGARIECGVRKGVHLEQYGTAISERIGKNLVELTGMKVEAVDVAFYHLEDQRPKDEKIGR